MRVPFAYFHSSAFGYDFRWSAASYLGPNHQVRRLRGGIACTFAAVGSGL